MTPELGDGFDPDELASFALSLLSNPETWRAGHENGCRMMTVPTANERQLYLLLSARLVCWGSVRRLVRRCQRVGRTSFPSLAMRSRSVRLPPGGHLRVRWRSLPQERRSPTWRWTPALGKPPETGMAPRLLRRPPRRQENRAPVPATTTLHRHLQREEQKRTPDSGQPIRVDIRPMSC